MNSAPSAGNTDSDTYRFTRLTTTLFIQDLGFSKSDAKPGTVVENVRVERLDGSQVTLDEVIGGRPTLIVFGSVSCPMTFGSASVMRRLQDEFGQQVRFVMLNVREAHPGENFEQPQSREMKHSHARLLASELHGHWETIVDGIDGELHRRLAEKPNAAFLLTPSREILFRSLWTGDERGLREALRLALQGLPLPKHQSTTMLGPLALGLGHFTAVLERSGSKAKRDLLLAAPPVALIAGLASALGPLPVHRRGAGALALVICVAVVCATALAWYAWS